MNLNWFVCVCVCVMEQNCERGEDGWDCDVC